MTLSLTPQEARSKLQQIEDASNQAVATLRQLNDTQQTMLGSGWKGGSATTYGNTSTTQHDDITQIINYLNQIVSTASAQISSVTTHDNS
jgi:uncharacterized protein YukE